MIRLLSLLTNLFPVWVLAAGVLAFFLPDALGWFDKTLIPWGLGVIMLGMGITLSIDDFKNVLRMPAALGAGVAAQFLLMPLLGWSIASLLRLDTPLAVGLILVSCCPGGTASNVVTYIARANVALSVLMTLCSTMLAILMTPLLTKWLAGTLVAVDGWGLFLSTVQVVLLPVLLGLMLHHVAPRLVRVVLPVAPLVSVLVIALICGSIIGTSRSFLRQSGLALIGAVCLLHVGGFGLGYLLARLFGYEKILCRTISIEVGMQNSGLGAVLAGKHFADPLTALPSAISATVHSIFGSVLAGIWRMGVKEPGSPVALPARESAAATRPASGERR